MFNFLKKKKQPVETKQDNQLYALGNGDIVGIEEVNDQVFSQKMMGDGFALVPTSNTVFSPVSGKVTSVFPTKHAIGFLMDNGLEVLLHMGIDTVELQGKPFSIKMSEGDTVLGGQEIGTIDLEMLKEAGKDNPLMVVFTNTADKLESLSLTKGTTTETTVIGQVVPK